MTPLANCSARPSHGRSNGPQSLPGIRRRQQTCTARTETNFDVVRTRRLHKPRPWCSGTPAPEGSRCWARGGSSPPNAEQTLRDKCKKEGSTNNTEETSDQQRRDQAQEHIQKRARGQRERHREARGKAQRPEERCKRERYEAKNPTSTET